MKSEFLSEIAKKYNQNIEYVAFDPCNGDLGRAYRSHDQIEKYRIYINSDEMLCSIQTLFIFFHELGHVVLDHLGFKLFSKNYPRDRIENEADTWAYKKMGLIDSRGEISGKDMVCYNCIRGMNASCWLDPVVFNKKCPRGVTLKALK